MQDAPNRLLAFPQLATWFEENKNKPPGKQDPVSYLVWSTCKSLTEEDEQLVVTYCAAVKNFFDRSNDGFKDFRVVESTLQTGGLSFMELSSEIAELAIRMNRGMDFFALMRSVADKTNLAVFRFLGAWTALNCDHLEACIEECEKVDEPFACIHTIHGQALLECGRALDAIEVLEVAIALSPKELLAQFQLAKAYHVTEQYDKAWDKILSCEVLNPKNEEVAAMMCLVALAQRTSKEKLMIAWNYLFPHLESCGDNEVVVTMLFDIAFLLKQKNKADLIVKNTDWDKLKSNASFLQKTPWLLKKLDQQKWQDTTVNLLSAMTENLGNTSQN